MPIVLTGGTAAYAYWSSTASGSATIETTSATPLTISASASPLPALYPGRVVTFGFSVTNPNIYQVELTTLTGVTVVSSDEEACPAVTHITLPPEVVTGLADTGYVLPAAISIAPSSSTEATLADLITMDAGAPDGCQGKTFTVTLSFTGSQV